jgi:hypothetical protein
MLPLWAIGLIGLLFSSFQPFLSDKNQSILRAVEIGSLGRSEHWL